MNVLRMYNDLVKYITNYFAQSGYNLNYMLIIGHL
jgi:hypothetical protein